LDAIRWGFSAVTVLRTTVLLVCAIAGIMALRPAKVSAQWWSRTPTDFEECADAAEKASTREARTDALAECNAKFAGRRKPGGGYTYYDFMQDRTFDIAGPNPTPDEQKKIDQEYTGYLEGQRRSKIAAALNAKQLQQQEQQQLQPPAPQPPIQQVSLRSETEKVPVPVASPVKQAARVKAAQCAKNAFSCEWPRLSQGIDDIKKLFTSQPSSSKPAKRG